MCLIITSTQNYSFAKVDIVVYKILICNESINDEYRLTTPFYHHPITIGRTYRSRFSFNNEGDVEKALHSFSNLDDARRFARSYGSYGRIIKCQIPKGSKYYKGYFGKYLSYASSRITYLEEIK